MAKLRNQFFDDTADRTNTVNRYDGHSIWVAPSSLAKHGLKNGQTLTKDEWNRLGNRLAAEWLEYVESYDNAPTDPHHGGKIWNG